MVLVFPAGNTSKTNCLQLLQFDSSKNYNKNNNNHNKEKKKKKKKKKKKINVLSRSNKMINKRTIKIKSQIKSMIIIIISDNNEGRQ